MGEQESWQVTGSAAAFYEEYFVPAIFSQWAPVIVETAGIQPGDRILDVACGTGIAARAAAAITGKKGSVIGYDLNAGMLEVAEKIAPYVAWRQGPAENLPYDDALFDSVISQFALMFFQDPHAALSEMYRVLKPGKRMVVAVWDSLERAPGFNTLVELLVKNCGEGAADILRAPFNLGDVEDILALFSKAALPGVEIKTRGGAARFPSISAWVSCEVNATPIVDMITEQQFQQLLDSAEVELADYTNDSGEVILDLPAHLITVTKVQK
ncbi:MAG: methyltransferase domain-containing protein [Gammaproteobacteria bacterium]|nr:methyltransferase domain-containing protein [Gammaproteobacteria bacterium]